MKKILIALLLLVSTSAFAHPVGQTPLDILINRINSKIGPVATSGPGYEVEVRHDGEKLWINIMKVVKSCQTSPVYVLRGGKVTQDLKAHCETHSADLGTNTLWQITCFDMSLVQCEDHLEDQLTVEVVLDIVKRDIRDVELR